MAKVKRIDLFDPLAPVNTRGKRKNLKTDGQPDEALFQDLVDSVPFFDESNSRANLDTGGVEFKDEVGLVAITTNTKAKANTSGLEANRTLVVHAGQLPTVDATQSDVVADFNDVALSIAVDGTTTRNNFLARLSTNFKTWLGTLRTDLNTAEAEITSLRTLSGTATSANSLGTFTGATITNTNTVKGALQELETALELVSGGTITGGVNVGGGIEVFKAVNGLDLEFKTIKTPSVSGYITSTNTATEVRIELEHALLIANLVSPLYSKQIANIGAGSQVYSGGGVATPQLRSLVAGTGVLVVQNANEITFTIDETWLTNQINNTTTMVTSFLYHATSTQVQSFTQGGEKVRFQDDSTGINYDTGDSWTMAQWVANSAATSVTNIEFNARMVVEFTATDTLIIGAKNVTFRLVHETAVGVKTALYTQVISVLDQVPAQTFTLNFVAIPLTVGLLPIELNSKVYIEFFDAEDADLINVMTIATGAYFYNLEV